MIVLLTGRVWVSVWSGRTQPPILIQATGMFVRRPFKTFLRHTLLTNDAPRWNRFVLWLLAAPAKITGAAQRLLRLGVS